MAVVLRILDIRMTGRPTITVLVGEQRVGFTWADAASMKRWAASAADQPADPEFLLKRIINDYAGRDSSLSNLAADVGKDIEYTSPTVARRLT